QLGDRPRDPRHIYANPFQPEICPFLALGLYALAYKVGGSKNGKLFPGKDQYQRFSSFLSRKAGEASAEFAAYGVNPQDIGTHSCRKGSATYVASGCTAGPPMSAICIRAGWSVGNVQDRYIRYEAAGDQYVGRTVCGLPLSTHDFCVLPPHFAKTDSDGVPIPGVTELVAEAVMACFGEDLLPRLRLVAEFLLASVVFHRVYLRHALQTNHPAFGNVLFQQPGMLDRLEEHVLRATGVPPHVFIIRQLRKVLAAVVPIGVSELFGKLESNAMAAGHVTPASLKDALSDCLTAAFSRTGLNALVQNGGGGAGNAPEFAAPAAQRYRDVYTWADGSAHLVAEDWTLATTVPLLTMWEQWFLADPPLRLLIAHIVPKAQKKNVQNLRWIMGLLETEVKAKEGGVLAAEPTLAQLRGMYAAVLDKFPLPPLAGGRERRVGQMSWTTFVKEWRAVLKGRKRGR
ncbi:unnamed protein product, partial [Phaeothamnion confervicola]